MQLIRNSFKSSSYDYSHPLICVQVHKQDPSSLDILFSPNISYKVIDGRHRIEVIKELSQEDFNIYFPKGVPVLTYKNEINILQGTMFSDGNISLKNIFNFK